MPARLSTANPPPLVGAANPEDVMRSSPVSTMSRKFLLDGSQSTTTVAAGTGLIHAALAVCVAGGTFSHIRMCIGGTLPSNIAELRFGVWKASDGTRLLDTQEVQAALTAASLTLAINTIVDMPFVGGSNNLLTVDLATGDEVWLGYAARNTSGSSGSATFRGLGQNSLSNIPQGGGTNTPATATSPVLSPILSPQLTKGNSSWSGGSPLPQLSGGASSDYPWVELA